MRHATGVVVMPYAAERSPLYHRLTLVGLVWLIAAPVVLHSAGVESTALLVGVAVLPMCLLLILSSIVRRLPGGPALVLASPPRIELDPDGMSLWGKDGMVDRMSWDDIGGLQADHWFRGTLVGLDGSPIGFVDPAFVRPRVGWFRAPSLAVHVVRMRPDRYVLSRPANRFTQPYGFQRPSLDYAAPDLVAIQRRQDLLAIAWFVALIATLVLVIVLFPHGLGGTPG